MSFSRLTARWKRSSRASIVGRMLNLERGVSDKSTVSCDFHGSALDTYTTFERIPRGVMKGRGNSVQSGRT